MDTLEGGAGDDRYILLDDEAADIIKGGGGEDWNVLRVDVLDRMYEVCVAKLEAPITRAAVANAMESYALEKYSVPRNVTSY